MVASVCVRHERLGPIRGPLDRTAELSGRPQDRRLLLVDEYLGAESAAHVGSDDVQLVLGRDLDERGEHQAVDVRVLAREPQREIAGRRVVVADGRPRLHRVRDQPVVDQVETGHVVGAGEGFVGGRAVADLPVVAEVAGGLGVDLRRAVGEGVAHRHHAGQGGVARLHQLRRVPGLACALRDHDGHRVSHVAHGIDREHGVGAGPLCGSPSLPVTTQPQMSEPSASPATSAPVRTATTPGAEAAAEVSSVNVACGWVERTNAAWVWCARVVSSV